MSPPYLPKGKRLNVATGYQGNKIDISTYNNLNSFLNYLNLSFSASTSINTDTIKNNLSLHDSRKKNKQTKQKYMLKTEKWAGTVSGYLFTPPSLE